MFADGAFIFLGVWTLIHQLSYFCGLTFVQTWCLAWLGAPLGVFLYLRGSNPTLVADDAADRRVGWALPVAVLVAVVLTVCLIRPDGDDEDYLGYSLLSLDQQSLPMVSSPPMKLGYAMSSYDFLVASGSWASGLPLLVSYYFVWPAIMAILMILTQWRLYGLLKLRNSAMALLGLIVVMLAWGDVHRTPSNFGFVRLCQGKAALASLLVFAAILYWARLVERKEGRSGLLLFVAFVAGAGFSPTGIPLGIVIVGLLIASTFVGTAFRPDRKVLVWLFGALAYLIVVGLSLRYHFGYTSPGVSAVDGLRLFVPVVVPAGVDLPGVARIDVPGFVYTKEMLGFVLGCGARGGIALLCVAALPLTLRASPHRRLLSIYSIGCTTLMAFPWTSQWLARWSFATMSWRWLYAVPFVLAMVCALDRIDDVRVHVAVRRTLAVMALALFALVPRPWIVSAENWTRFSVPSYKTFDPTGILLRPYKHWARIEGPWLVSPSTGRRY
jgi:Family of unknown function (DUF6077)